MERIYRAQRQGNQHHHATRYPLKHFRCPEVTGPPKVLWSQGESRRESPLAQVIRCRLRSGIRWPPESEVLRLAARGASRLAASTTGNAAGNGHDHVAVALRSICNESAGARSTWAAGKPRRQGHPPGGATIPNWISGPRGGMRRMGSEV
eukprot:scaffold698_cov397-Pinguiococcus_pyrenoidosus.AAC.4